jgi:hypothetical protein
LFLGLDPFRYDADFKFTRQANGSADDGGFRKDDFQIFQETPRDLGQSFDMRVGNAVRGEGFAPTAFQICHCH